MRARLALLLGKSSRRMCSRAFVGTLLKFHGMGSRYTMKHRGRRDGDVSGWTRVRGRGIPASHFFAECRCTRERRGAFRTSDIFESKVLQWRSEMFRGHLNEVRFKGRPMCLAHFTFAHRQRRRDPLLHDVLTHRYTIVPSWLNILRNNAKEVEKRKVTI